MNEDLTIDDYQDVVKMFHEESDRAAAVLAGSFVDHFLAKYLRSYLINDPEIEKLFRNFGPFSSFSQRIECSYAIGIIDKQAKKDLNFIRKIRNHFAHHPKEASFTKSPVIDLCQNLSAAQTVEVPERGPFKVEKERDQYLIAIGIFVAKAHNTMLQKAAKNKSG